MKNTRSANGGRPPVCSLVFPCCNEEESVRPVLEKAQEAKELLGAASPPIGLEIIVVNDGSSDGSRNILSSFSCKKVHFEKRRGYGAALKAGFRKAEGEILGFCDMDSTCDPQEILVLLKALQESRRAASVVQGDRLHRASAMPLIRRIGNRLFSAALLLRFRRRLKDPCTGFRVFRRSALYERLFEFPDDLSFSLALSAFCLRNRIPVKELEISYSWRKGRSKLHPLKDGLIFLKSVLQRRPP